MNYNSNNRKILIAVTFRDFIDDENEIIQREFLKSIKNKSYTNYLLIVTIFNEKNVENVINEYDLNVKYVYDDTDIRHSFSRVIKNTFHEIKLHENIFLYTNADIVLENNFFEEVVNNFFIGCGGTSIPQQYYMNYEDYLNNIKYDKIKKVKINSDYAIDPNIYVPDVVFVDADYYLDNNNQIWWENNEIIGAWPGMAQSLMIALHSKNLINLYFKSKIKSIENIKDHNNNNNLSTKSSKRELDTAKNKLTVFDYAKHIGVDRKFYNPKRSFVSQKFRQHNYYKIRGNMIQKIKYYFYMKFYYYFPRGISLFSIIMKRLIKKLSG